MRDVRRRDIVCGVFSLWVSGELDEVVVLRLCDCRRALVGAAV